jgi:hypothetical protein
MKRPKNKTKILFGFRSHLDVAVHGVSGTVLCGRKKFKKPLDMM